MSFRKSAKAVSANQRKWTRNLTPFSQSFKKRQHKFKSIVNSLEGLCKLPKEVVIVGRYLALANSEKSRKVRIKLICNEITLLWQKMSFPILSNQTVERKVTSIIDKYDKFLKRPTAEKENSFSHRPTCLCDVTKTEGEWLCTEDKKFVLHAAAVTR